MSANAELSGARGAAADDPPLLQRLRPWLLPCATAGLALLAWLQVALALVSAHRANALVARSAVVQSATLVEELGGRRGYAPGFAPEVAYRVSAPDGQVLDGRTFALTRVWDADAEAARARIAPYSAGARVTAWCSETPHPECVLDRSAPNVPRETLACAILFSLLALGFGAFNWREDSARGIPASPTPRA